MGYKRKNGTGGITKMPGKRTNPYRVRITKGWLLDMVEGKSKQQIVTLGYYHTRVEAERALNDFINMLYFFIVRTHETEMKRSGNEVALRSEIKKSAGVLKKSDNYNFLCYN